MDTTSIVEFIKKNYPKVVFNPVKLAYKNALGFVVTGDKLIIGFLTKSGTLCKLAEPLDLANITNESIGHILSKIPLVEGFTKKDKERLYRVFQTDNLHNVTKSEHEQIVNELKMSIENANSMLIDKESQYKVLLDTQANQHLAIAKEHADKLQAIQEQYAMSEKQLDECKNNLIKEKQAVADGIESYKNSVKDYIKERDIKIEELEKVHKVIKEESDVMKNKLESLLKAEQEKLKVLESNRDLISEYDDKLVAKTTEVEKLTQNIVAIKNELDNLKSELSKSKLKEVALTNYRQECQNKLLKEKDLVIEKIKDYNKQWMAWSNTVQDNVAQYKKKLVEDMKTVQLRLEEVLKTQDLERKEYAKLKQSVKDVEAELKDVIAQQLAQLTEKEEQIRMLQSTGSGFVMSDDSPQKDEEIRRLQKELDDIRKLLVENANTKVENSIDYDNCFNILQNFFALNNIFYRKREIINRLDDIIYKNLGTFTQLNDQVKDNIKNKYEIVKTEILNHIKFLDLAKYINSPNFQYLKSKATRSKVPADFCVDLTNILDYWNENKAKYREQDTQLTNIYEDLSGAVRVYIRVKPLVGSEQRGKTVSIKEMSRKKQKSVNLKCDSKSIDKQFGDFFGVFEDTYDTVDVYTGIQDTPKTIHSNDSLRIDVDSIVEHSESISPGLYSVFKQVEDGYSIVLFGYGLSGSGKTHTLLGSKVTPGLVHYGLANLNGVTNIKLKYLFEQYVSAVDANFGKVRGKIHNLIREVPQMREYSKNETSDFANSLPGSLNVDKLAVEDLFALTSAIETYRVTQGRIKKTPNNPQSSRSHLFFVFEVSFATGKTGYVTIVDTAGRESPLDIFEMFIDDSKTKLASVMAPPPVGGEDTIAKSMNINLDAAYTPRHILEVLREGFYINETINHMVYYFNKKNYKKTKVIVQPDDVSKYTVWKYYVSPMSEEKALNASNNCLTIPLLKFLDNLSNKKQADTEYKPTKFIMICNVRQEEIHCDQTVETLAFAQTIAST